jgi:hypothetical protein
MTDDALLERLAARARGRGSDPLSDPRWLERAAGTINAADRAVLEQMVAAGDVPAESMAAHVPIGDAVRERYAAAALEAMEAETGAPEVESPAPVIDLASRRSSRRWVFGAGALAAAAALFLVMRPSIAPIPTPDSAPAFELEFRGGDRVFRSDDSPPVLREGAPFEFLIRPETAVATPTVDAFIIRGENRSAWAIRPQISEHGAIRISGRLGVELDATPGPVTVEIVVTVPGRTPSVLHRSFVIDPPT